MLRHAGRYDPAYPMRTWLLTIARRLSINRGRRERRTRPDDTLGNLPGAGPRPDELAAQRDDRRRLAGALDHAIAQLTAPQRQAILLFHQQGLGIGDVARAMNLPQNTVKSHLHRGRATMRKILSGSAEVHTP